MVKHVITLPFNDLPQKILEILVDLGQRSGKIELVRREWPRSGQLDGNAYEVSTTASFLGTV